MRSIKPINLSSLTEQECRRGHNYVQLLKTYMLFIYLLKMLSGHFRKFNNFCKQAMFLLFCIASQTVRRPGVPRTNVVIPGQLVSTKRSSSFCLRNNFKNTCEIYMYAQIPTYVYILFYVHKYVSVTNSCSEGNLEGYASDISW